MLINAVAPFAGAWIEIVREGEQPFDREVAPFAGAWIEIGNATPLPPGGIRRSLRGSVD